MKKLITRIVSAVCVFAMAFSIASCSFFAPQAPKHECESKCPICEKCLDAECTEDACADKCEGHVPPHTCESVCPECGKCLDAECTETACAEKCEGHHVCESVCPECGKCLDAECTEAACAEKCEGHVVYVEYTFEAEDSNQEGWSSKMKVATGKTNASGGAHVGGIGNTEGDWYLLFEVYAKEACEVTMSYRFGGSKVWLFEEELPTFVNGKEIETTAQSKAGGWENYITYEVATVQLQAGKNTIKMSIGMNAFMNFDCIKLSSAVELSATAFAA